MKRFMTLMLLPLLVACTSPQTPAQAVYAAESQYATALRVELAYSNLPRCGKPTGSVLCSEVSVIKKAQKADDIAWIALKQAENAVRTPGFGESKLTAAISSAKALVGSFVQITQTLKVR